MNLEIMNIKRILLICLAASSGYANSQDSTFYFTIDTASFYPGEMTVRSQARFNYIYHSPESKDSVIYKSHHDLIHQNPTDKNHVSYFDLACALWQLEKIDEAEKMFLKIVGSGNQHYSSTYHHSSDIPGDATVNSYGYGSYTSNYKNAACVYLTKIYIEKKKYNAALSFLEKAVKIYKVSYSCGTGSNQQKDMYNFLYAACCDGLERYNDVIQLLLPDCLNRNDKLIVKALRKIYTQDQILQYLSEAENSITCLVDTAVSYSYLTSNYGLEDEKIDTLKYYSGTGTIRLFNQQIDLPIPNLNDGETLTRRYYEKLFRDSEFYQHLASVVGITLEETKNFENR